MLQNTKIMRKRIFMLVIVGITFSSCISEKDMLVAEVEDMWSLQQIIDEQLIVETNKMGFINEEVQQILYSNLDTSFKSFSDKAQAVFFNERKSRDSLRYLKAVKKHEELMLITKERVKLELDDKNLSIPKGIGDLLSDSNFSKSLEVLFN